MSAQPLFTLLPTMNKYKLFIDALFIAISLNLAFGFVGMTFLLDHHSMDEGLTFQEVQIGALVYITTTFLCFMYKFLTYQQTRYDFYPEHVSYTESFLNVEEKDIQFSRIVEVVLKRSVLQRFFGLGTIVLQTHATANMAQNSWFGNATGQSGLQLLDIENYKEAYPYIKQMIKNAKKEV